MSDTQNMQNLAGGDGVVRGGCAACMVSTGSCWLHGKISDEILIRAGQGKTRGDGSLSEIHIVEGFSETRTDEETRYIAKKVAENWVAARQLAFVPPVSNNTH